MFANFGEQLSFAIFFAQRWRQTMVGRCNLVSIET